MGNTKLLPKSRKLNFSGNTDCVTAHLLDIQLIHCYGHQIFALDWSYEYYSSSNKRTAWNTQALNGIHKDSDNFIDL